MELRQYWSIIRARWLLVVALTVVAGALSIILSARTLSTYQAVVRLAIRPELEQRSGEFYGYDGYYAYVASELLIDDLGKVVEGKAFLEDVQAEAVKRGGQVPFGTFEVKKAHRVTTVEATANRRDDALALVGTAADMLRDPESRYFKDIAGTVPNVALVSGPEITSATPVSRMGLDIAIRTLLGLFAGVALAFFLDYLDDTVRNRRELEQQLELAVLGEIP